MLLLKCFVSPPITQGLWDLYNMFFWDVYGQAGWSTALFQLFRRWNWRNWGWSWNCTSHSVKKERAGVESPQIRLSWVGRVRLYRHGLEKKKFLKKFLKKSVAGETQMVAQEGLAWSHGTPAIPWGQTGMDSSLQGPSPLDLCNSTSQLTPVQQSWARVQALSQECSEKDTWRAQFIL